MSLPSHVGSKVSFMESLGLLIAPYVAGVSGGHTLYGGDGKESLFLSLLRLKLHAELLHQIEHLEIGDIFFHFAIISSLYSQWVLSPL
jgi:hypothetical protein